MEFEVEIESSGEKPPGFDDCISKVALDTARIRMETTKTFADVMGWDNRIFSAAMSLSILLEIIGHAAAATQDGTEEDLIKFVDALADSLKNQVRGGTATF